jgi:hypothetical protein
MSGRQTIATNLAKSRLRWVGSLAEKLARTDDELAAVRSIRLESAFIRHGIAPRERDVLAYLTERKVFGHHQALYRAVVLYPVYAIPSGGRS